MILLERLVSEALPQDPFFLGVLLFTVDMAYESPFHVAPTSLSLLVL